MKDCGCKYKINKQNSSDLRTVSHLIERINKEGKNGIKLWEDIKDVVGLAFASAESKMLPWYTNITTKNRYW
jgi:hypothetical protein